MAFFAAMLAAGCGRERAEKGAGEAPAAPIAAAPETNAGPAVQERAVALGTPFAGEIGAGEIHRFPLALEAGHYVQVVAEQRGGDVELAFVGPGGDDLLVMDSPTEGWGPERLAAVAERSGGYWIEVRPFAAGGAYGLAVEALRRATPADRRRARAYRIFHRAVQRRDAARDAEDRRAALEGFAEAADLWRRAEHPHGEGLARYGAARTWMALGEREPARAAFAEALPLLAAAGLTFHRANALHLTADLYEEDDLLEEAITHYRRAAAERRAVGDPAWLAKTLNTLGNTLLQASRTDEALAALDEALAIRRRLGRAGPLAVSLHDRGKALLEVGRYDEARADLEAAGELWRRSGDEVGTAKAFVALAQVEQKRSLAPVRGRRERFDKEGLRRALALFETALEIYRRDESLRDGSLRPEVAGVLLERARCLRRLGEAAAAREELLEARAIYRTRGSRRDLGLSDLELGSLALDGGSPGEALTLFGRAREHFEAIGDRSNRVAALGFLAVARREGGDLAAADALFAEALAALEGLRDDPREYAHQALFLAPRLNYYELYVDLLMERHGRALAEGSAAAARGFAERALEVHERSRARALLGSLGAPPDRPGPAPDRPDPAPLTVAEIRRSVLDPGTLLLEIHPGAQRSFLWAVTRDRLAVFELPPRDELDRLALEAHALLAERPTMRGAARLESVLATLGALLLAPATELLESAERLLVVPDGALQYVPFASLPSPLSTALEGAPLVGRHEVVQLPSASLLAALRAEAGLREPASMLLAVVYDPVFGRGDPRLAGDGGDVVVGARRGGDRSPYPRLPASRREAAALFALAPAGRTLRAEGFAATRELVTGGALGGHRIVHLATHGELAGREPRLVFSRFAADGRSRSGVVTAAEIAHLDLAADLVVLSGCRTALGDELRGEGVVGLPQAFFRAGASRVLVSLWGVEDEATAVLMAAFYRFLFAGLPPAEALRRAQLELRAEPAWRSPHVWAPFVLQGDWRAPSLPLRPPS